MRVYRRKRSSGVFSLLVMVAGLAVMGYALFGQGPSSAGDARASDAPLNQTMSLTVPEMSRVSDIPVYTGPADAPELDEGALHLQGTGFPWQGGANTYIAGHRLGYPNTGSFLVFRDLDRLQNGDEVILTDSNGTTYTYSVFREFVVGPNEQRVTQPVPGRTVVSLQTCTLPNFTDRLIVQAELVSVS
ncbi:class E sortase [Rubrobacter aplysinae]|uniref:class E sortase n=1 Tax=Rubrobacter aplysinae TaxID=909625 RepID=UPI00069E7F5E|nr:class E sortase [Rubrobacter aplysinae]